MVETRFVCRNVQDVDGPRGERESSSTRRRLGRSGFQSRDTRRWSLHDYHQRCRVIDIHPGNKYRVTFERLPEAQADESGHS